jgi:hypothetical protein
MTDAARSTARNAVIVGMGRTGLSVARHLQRCGYGISITDSRDAPPELAGVKALGSSVVTRTGGFDPMLLERADIVVTSPGVPLDDPFFTQARARGLDIVGDIELHGACARAELRRGAFSLAEVTCADPHAYAAVEQLPRDGEADATVRSGHQRDRVRLGHPELCGKAVDLIHDFLSNSNVTVGRILALSANSNASVGILAAWHGTPRAHGANFARPPWWSSPLVASTACDNQC